MVSLLIASNGIVERCRCLWMRRVPIAVSIRGDRRLERAYCDGGLQRRADSPMAASVGRDRRVYGFKDLILTDLTCFPVTWFSP